LVGDAGALALLPVAALPIWWVKSAGLDLLFAALRLWYILGS